MPACLQGIVATLIQKLKGDDEAFRSIGTMPGLYRVWARCRAPLARQWERERRLPALGHQSGRSLLELVFMRGLLAEAGAHDRQPEASACFMWDLSNFYEHVPRDRLWELGQTQGYRTPLLAVTLNQYAAKRIVSFNGLAKDTKYPSKGIAAGLGVATYLVQILALPSLQSFRVRFPLVWLTIFIDDLLVQAGHRREARVVSFLSEAGAGLADIIETDWESRVAAHKSVIVGSSDSLCKSLQTAFGAKAGQAQTAASNLGVGTTMGKRRTARAVPTFRGRLAKLRRRGRRLRALKEAAPEPLSMTTVFKTGLPAFGYFGPEVVGMDDSGLGQAQHHFLSLCGCPSQSKNKHLSLCLLTDPLWRQGVAPILAWATIVWKAATDRALFAIWPLPWLGKRRPRSSRASPRDGGRFEAHWGQYACPSRESAGGLSRPSRSPTTGAWWIDFEVSRKNLQDRTLSAKSRQLILRHLCHALWSRERLYHVGYDVPQGCER